MKQNVYKEAVIKVRLPNELIIEARFGPLERLSDVFALISSIIIGDLYLYQSPPVKRLDKDLGKSLMELDSVPTGSFYLGINSEWYIKHELPNAFGEGDWIEESEGPLNSLFQGINSNRSRILRHKITKELIEEYELQFISQEDLNFYVKELELRKKMAIVQSPQSAREEQDGQMQASPYVYHIRFFKDGSTEQMCSTVYRGLLYLDKVELRMT
ncbi:unnamed protein product [Sphagnum balticum]